MRMVVDDERHELWFIQHDVNDVVAVNIATGTRHDHTNQMIY